MTSRLVRFALLALLLGSPARATSTFGREFWLAWPRTPDATSEDPGYDLGAELVVVAADGPVSVRVTAPGVDRIVSAAPGSPASVALPRSVMVPAAGIATGRGIHAAGADGSCGLFGVLLRVPGRGASVADDVARILPVDLLGERTLALSYWGESEVVVVATQDATQVTIADATCPEPGTMILNRGDAWLHECVRAAGDGSDSGALVTASAPVAVVSGSASSSIVNHEAQRPGARAYWGWDDVLLESPWPADMLGREHVHSPFRRDAPDAAGDLVRIVAACADTSVRVTETEGTRSWTLPSPGDHADVESPDIFERSWRLLPGAARVSSNRGVLVGAFTVGGLNAGVGDPSLTVLDPVERWEREAVAWMPTGYEHSLSIVTEASAAASVRVDGAVPPGAWTDVPGTSFAWLRMDRLTGGERRIRGDAPLAAQAVGYTPGSAGAVSCPALPLRRDALGAVGGLRIRGVDPCATSCPGGCVTLRAPPGLATYSWSTGGAGAQVTECPDVTTLVVLAATDAAGCRYEGSATLVVLAAPNAPAIEGPASACAGACIELAAPAGYDSYLWGGGERTRTILACPTVDTVYQVTVSGPGGCGGDASHAVTVHGPPVAGDGMASHPDPCLRGLELTWLEAAWRPGSPGGVYNVYRREGGCAPVDDPSWSLVAVGLAGPPWRDLTTVPGRTYAYLVEAEDAPEEGACNPGPAHGGSTGRRCMRPTSGLSDPGDPDAPRLVSFSPHLRASGYERAIPGGPATAATFAWPTLPPLDPATHVEAWRGTDPRLLVRVDPLVAGPEWRDAAAGDAWLLFYKVFNATACGGLGE